MAEEPNGNLMSSSEADTREDQTEQLLYAKVLQTVRMRPDGEYGNSSSESRIVNRTSRHFR